MQILSFPGEDGALRFSAVFGWPLDMVGYPLRPGRQSHAGFTIEREAPVVVADFKAKDCPFIPPPIAEEAGIISGMSVPMFAYRVDKPIGAMLVHTRVQRTF